MNALLTFWFILIIAEAVRNWYVIEKLKKPVDHVEFTILRIGVSVLYWAFAYSWVMSNEMPFESWLFMPVMMSLTFWFHFDLLLNILRGKHPLYYGEGSWLDRIQRKFPLPATWLKFLLAYSAITVWYKGLDII